MSMSRKLSALALVLVLDFAFLLKATNGDSGKKKEKKDPCEGHGEKVWGPGENSDFCSLEYVKVFL